MISMASSTSSASGGAVVARAVPSRSGAPARERGRFGAVAVAAVAGLALLAVGVVWDLMIGARPMSAGQVLNALFGSGHSLSAEIVRTIRLPRVLMAVMVGFAMAVAGVLMQGATNNPLAAPDIVGVSAGASLVVVVAATVVAQVSGVPLVLLSILGAAVAALSVMTVAGVGQGRGNPVRLALAGVTATAMLLAFTQALLLLHQNGTAGVFFWLVGGVNYATWSQITVALPWIVAGTAGALWLAASMNLLALGDDTARGVGLDVDRARLLAVACVVCLAGAGVAVAGPIAFVGVIVPHITRRLVGTDHLVLIPMAGLFGAALLVAADVACRFIQFPFETPTGIVTAMIGAPFFLYLARRQKAEA